MSSWLRTAVSKAVEASGRGGTEIARAVANYADAVVTGGARILNDRMGMKHITVKEIAKRLEEAAVSARGLERTQLLKRWLLALRGSESGSRSSTEGKTVEQHQSGESTAHARKGPPILYIDVDSGREPVDFQYVFLYSQALEGITLSMILEAPSEEEVSILLEIFGFCLSGGKEVHNALVSSIQDLAKALSNYQEEVLVKREDLLQFTQGAISGLKYSAGILRIDAETSRLQQRLSEMESKLVLSSADSGNASEKTAVATVEALKLALAEVRICSRMEELACKKKLLTVGESAEVHSQKVEKLKVLATSLANSSSKAEKRILDHRRQKEEALNFRTVKENEVSTVEKELAAEISGLEKQRDELEAQLSKVNISLNAALGRLKKTREEKDQFDEASDKIVLHLSAKEDELSKSVALCKVEANIVKIWIDFLNDTWELQSTYSNQKEKQTDEELEQCSTNFLTLLKHHLVSFKEMLKPSVGRINKFVDNLKTISENRPEITEIESSELSSDSNPRRYLEEEYLETERKIIAAFSVADHMKKLFYSQKGSISRRDDPELNALFTEIEKLREEFEFVERPTLQIEIPRDKPPLQDAANMPSPAAVPLSPTAIRTDSPKSPATRNQHPSLFSGDQHSDAESELAKLEVEIGNDAKDFSADEISGWEFDELEEELRAGAAEPS